MPPLAADEAAIAAGVEAALKAIEKDLQSTENTLIQKTEEEITEEKLPEDKVKAEENTLVQQSFAAL